MLKKEEQGSSNIRREGINTEKKKGGLEGG